jgi:hypothetical protein
MGCCWIIQALAARHTLDADGVSYLNIADACLRGDWHALVNGYWSPGLPFLLALWLKLFHPTSFYVPLAFRLFAVVSLVSALVAFEYFLKAFFRFRTHLFGPDQGSVRFISDNTVRILGYILFLWITVFFIPARLDQPEILVCTLYLLATALSMEIVSSSRERWRHFLALGVVLGCAFLVKAVMFPLSFTFFAALVLHKQVRQSLPKLAISVAAFIALSLPFIIALSRAKGRLTYGDAGAINYLQMAGPDVAQPVSAGPSQESSIRFVAAPHVADYTKILFLGTYPPWADPSFRYRPKVFHFNLRRQLNRIHIVLKIYFDLFIVQLGALVCGLLVLIFYSRDVALFVSRFSKEIVLWFPAVSGLSLFALVRVEGRFLAGFTVALFASCVAAIRFEDEASRDRIAKSVVPAVVMLLAAQVLIVVGHDALQALSPNYPDWQVVEALKTMGLNSGDRVSYLGDTLSDHTWAYLGNLSIAAEIPEEDQPTYWAATQEEKQQVISWIAQTGSKALVTRNVPLSGLSAGWQRVDATDYYILKLP